MLRIKCNHGEILECRRDWINVSGVFQNAKNGEITIPQDAAMIRKILSFMEHHSQKPLGRIAKPVPETLQHVVSPWDWDFCQSMSLVQIMQLIPVGMELKINGLSELCAAYAATCLRFKSKEQVQALMSKPPPLFASSSSSSFSSTSIPISSSRQSSITSSAKKHKSSHNRIMDSNVPSMGFYKI